MKVLIIGLGSIGQRHTRILLDKYHFEVFALRSNTNEVRIPGINELHSWEEVKKIQPDVVFITNPTAFHIETALRCANLNCKLFIEKPIGKDLEGLEKLIGIIKKRKLVTYVAYNLRFHPIIEELKKYFSSNTFLHMSVITTSYYPNWRITIDHKKLYTAKAFLGGGVILDLSHEIDYTSYLLGEVLSIKGQFSKRSNVTVDTEDYADMLLQTNKGPCNIHVNFFSQKRQRIIQIDFADKTLEGDIINSVVKEYQNEKLVRKKQLETNYDLSYEKQIKYFIDNLDNPNMMNNVVEASNLFKEIVKFKENG